MTNRKTLKRQYLETKTRAGVYAIRNRITGRALVAGSTIAQELEMLVSLWRQEIPCFGERGYDEPRSEP